MILALPMLVGLLAITEPGTPGVTIRIWSIGENMSDIFQVEPGQLPNDVAVIPSLELHDSADFMGHEDHFILLADGSIAIDRPGVYEFQLTSDDGSELWIAGNQVIDHGGLHGAESLTGRMALEAGLHPFQVKYFENTGDAMLELAWKPPASLAFTPIPGSSLRTNAPGNQPTAKGRKSIVRERLNRYPGHGAPLEGVHPGLQLKRHAIEDLDGRVTAMDWLDDGQMILLTDAGTLWAVGSQWATQAPYLWVMAEGLDDPGGLVVADDGIWVIQREELTRLNDLDGDGRIDEYLAMATGWPVAGEDAGRARGLVASGDDFLAMLTRARDEHGQPVGSEHRGTVLRLSRDGSWEIVASGLVEPECFIQGFPLGNAFIDTSAFGGISILDEGQPVSKRQGVGLQFYQADPRAACWIGSGPWQDQMLVADGSGGGLWRLRLDPHDAGVQGCAFRASQGLGERLDHIAMGPDGHAWVLARDQDGASVNRLSIRGTPAFEISGIRAHSNGLEVTFTHGFDPLVASDPASWLLLSSGLAGEGAPGLVADLQIRSASLLPDGRSFSRFRRCGINP